MNNYNQVQLAYRQKCKERIQRQLEISEDTVLAVLILFRSFFKIFESKILLNFFLAGRSVTEGEVEEMLESGNPAVFTQGVRTKNLNKNLRLLSVV